MSRKLVSMLIPNYRSVHRDMVYLVLACVILISSCGGEATSKKSLESKSDQVQTRLANEKVKLTEKWAFTFKEADWLSSPILSSNGTILFAKSGGYLFAVTPEGKQIFKLERELPFVDMAISKDDTIYFGTESGQFFAIDTNGKTKWLHDTGNSTNILPAVSNDGTVYYGDEGGNIYALSAVGKLKWSVTTTDYTILELAACGSDGTVYLGDADGGFYALNANGQWLWKKQVSVPPLPIDAIPRLAIGNDDTIYFGCVDGSLCALSSNGDVLWSFKTNAQIVSSPTLGRNGELLISGGQKVFAVAADGSKLWEFKTEAGEYLSRPVVDKDGIVYVISTNQDMVGRLYAIGANGRLSQSIETDAFPMSTPIIDDEKATLYMLSLKGKLYAISIR